MQFFRKFPPIISIPISYCIVTVTFLWRFMTATLWGTFVLSLSLYSMMWIFGHTRPFAPRQLLLWTFNLPNEYKIVILSSILTIIGFLIAFHTATINWKQQMHAQLKANVAGEIETFFNEVSTLIIKAKLYAESLLEAVNKIQNEQITDETLFIVRYRLEQTPHFLATRDRLVNLSTQVHRILGKNYSILATSWGATENLQQAIEAFIEVTDAIWIQIPYIHPEEPDLLNVFLTQVNVSEYLRFIKCCEKNFGFINGTIGSVTGQLLAPVVGFNLSSLVNLVSIRTQFRQFIEEYYRSRKDKASIPPVNPKEQKDEP